MNKLVKILTNIFKAGLIWFYTIIFPINYFIATVNYDDTFLVVMKVFACAFVGFAIYHGMNKILED
jgi:hypothetical protein